tara:strand:+ start:220 stop:489 length:270 start_codon:yes stop_codon:yes gene_type:complete
MAKKTQDLKITDKELENIQGKVKVIQSFEASIGRAEVSKIVMYKQMENVQDELRALQVELEEKYGKVQINLQDGTISEIPSEDEVDKKD